MGNTGHYNKIIRVCKIDLFMSITNMRKQNNSINLNKNFLSFSYVRRLKKF